MSDQDEKISNALEQMEVAIHRSYTNPEEMVNHLQILDRAEEMLPNKYDLAFLRHALREKVMRNFIESLPTESEVHEWFKESCYSVLGSDYKIVNRKNDPKHIPDFWLIRQESYVPVEIKLNKFDPRHLRQLQRYMDFYHCSEGIAVAKELNCQLPDNVKFIKYDLA